MTTRSGSTMRAHSAAGSSNHVGALNCWSVLLLPVCLAGLGCAALQLRGKRSDELVRILAAPETSPRARRAACRLLVRRPPAEVLPELFPVYEARMNDTLIMPGHSWERFDVGEPVSWWEAARITSYRAWHGNLDNPAFTHEEKGAALLEILDHFTIEDQHTESDRIQRGPECPSSEGVTCFPHDYREFAYFDHALHAFGALLGGLTSNWVDGTEARLASILQNADLASRYRCAAASALIEKTGEKYYSPILLAAEQAPLACQKAWAEMLIEYGVRRSLGGAISSDPWKGRVLRFSVGVLQALRAANGADDGYYLAGDIGRSVGRDFSESGADRRETVDNALTWWSEHSGQFPE
jgi:hypothetical protein